MVFVIHIENRVIKEDIPKLSKTDKSRIRKAIKEKLETSPEIFGKPLRNSLKGYRSLRVGDYRVIFRIDKNKVLVFAVMHRKFVYIYSPDLV